MIRLTKKSRIAAAISAAIASQLIVSPSAFSDGGDFNLDFVASEPTSYSHATGGGAYNDRTINTDVVESLEGGDFACGDIVTFLKQIEVDAGAVGAQTIRERYEFTAHATGQQGVALVDNTAPGSTSAAINTSAIDSGTVDDGGSVANVVSEGLSGAGVFIKPTTFFREVDVTDLEAGETVVVRTDVQIACNGQSPTGNMQARLASATANPITEPDAIGAGDQTIPFKRVVDIGKCVPSKEVCGDGIDNDCDGQVDEGCAG